MFKISEIKVKKKKVQLPKKLGLKIHQLDTLTQF